MKEIWQAHFQFKDGSSQVLEQRELESADDMRQFAKDVREKYPLEEGVQYLMVPEDSPRFILMK